MYAINYIRRHLCAFGGEAAKSRGWALLGAEPPKAVGGRKIFLGIGVKFWEIGVKNMLDAGRHPQVFLSTDGACTRFFKEHF